MRGTQQTQLQVRNALLAGGKGALGERMGWLEVARSPHSGSGLKAKQAAARQAGRGGRTFQAEDRTNEDSEGKGNLFEHRDSQTAEGARLTGGHPGQEGLGQEFLCYFSSGKKPLGA